MKKSIFNFSTFFVLSSLLAFSSETMGETQQLSISFPPSLTVLLNDLAVREDGRIKVSGTPGYWNNDNDLTQGDFTLSREAAFDGDDSTFFDPCTASNLLGNCWAGIEFDTPQYVTKIRYKGRIGGNNVQLAQMTGCIFQGANLADFSDAENIAVADIAKDAVASKDNDWKTWNGVNYWAEIDLSLLCDAENPFSAALRSCKSYKYLRIIGPNPYIPGNNQNGMCCGNVGELEFYGFSASIINAQEGYDDAAYTPEISGQHDNGEGTISFNIEFKVMESADAPETAGGFLYGYEIFRQEPSADASSYASELVEAAFMMADSENDISTFSFSDSNMMPNVRYLVRSFNLAANTPDAYYLTPVPSITPEISAVVSEINTGAKITWRNEADEASYIAGVNVYRGTAPGGPWTKVNSSILSLDTLTYTDENVQGGVLYYYCVSYVFYDTYSVEHYEGPLSDVVSFAYSDNIERVWSEDGTTSTLKPGMTAICHYQPWDASGDPANLFDNNFSTISDITPKSNKNIRDDGTAKAGVDLGKAYVITHARIYPRTNGMTVRFNKLALFGSNEDSTGAAAGDGWRDDANCVQLTPRFQNPSPMASFYEIDITDSTPYRYIFIKHAGLTAEEKSLGYEAFANAAELQLFGYPADTNLADVLIAPLSTSVNVFSTTDNPHGKTGVSLSWQDSPNAAFYQVERKIEGSDEWIVVATDLTQTSFFYELDDVANPGFFRIASVREHPEQEGENEYAYSRQMRPYVLGSGTGLWAVYSCPYDLNIARTKEWIKRVDPTIDGAWGGQKIIPECDESTNDVHIVWSGKLIAPLSGVYNFKVNCNDAFALRIDSTQVINNWDGNKANAQLYRGDVYLEAGEHKIRADYHTMTEGGAINMFCNLEWGGVVNSGPIPSSQLIPEPLTPMSYPWFGEHTFEAKTKGYAEFVPTYEIVQEVGKDGITRDVEKMIDGFVISGAGDDFWIKETAAHMVWRMVTGDFLISAKFERQINAKPGQDNDSGWAWKGMLVARKDLGAAPPVVCACFASNGFAGRADLKIRDHKGGDIYDYQARHTGLPAVVYQKLQRVGNVFTQSFSEDGKTWEVVKTYVDEEGMMDGVLYVGPAVSSIADLRELGTYRVTVVKVECDPGSGIVYVR